MAGDKVLFLDIGRFEDGNVLRGGALVTDITTEPLEFRCTSAVRPTRLQRILWGARLTEHVATTLLGEPLIKSLQQDYSLVAVRDGDFIQLRETFDTPLVRLAKHGQVDFGVPGGPKGTRGLGDPGPDASEGENCAEGQPSILQSATGRFEPVVVQTHRDYPGDLEVARRILHPIFHTRDVLEPFDRIQTALVVVNDEERRKAGR